MHVVTDTLPSGASPLPHFLTALGFQDQVGYKAAARWLLLGLAITEETHRYTT
ncbi:hypothetical protein ACVWZP_000541 [Pseudomonas sp. TE36184]